MDKDDVKLIFHYGGQLIRARLQYVSFSELEVIEGKFDYIGGEEFFVVVDRDKLSIMEIAGMCGGREMAEIQGLWYLKPGFKIDDGLRQLVFDLDVLEMVSQIKEDQTLHIYVQHVKEVEIDFLKSIYVVHPPPKVLALEWYTPPVKDVGVRVEEEEDEPSLDQNETADVEEGEQETVVENLGVRVEEEEDEPSLDQNETVDVEEGEQETVVENLGVRVEEEEDEPSLDQNDTAAVEEGEQDTVVADADVSTAASCMDEAVFGSEGGRRI